MPNGEPHCGECPLSHLCRAREQGLTGEIPVRSKAKPRKIENRTVLIFKDGKSLPSESVLEKGLLAGLYEFPNLTGHLPMDEVTAYSKEIGLAPIRIRPLEKGKTYLQSY